MRRGHLGAQREACGDCRVTLRYFLYWLLCGCLLLSLGGCGNKGPLVLPEEEEEKEERQKTQDY